jgi:hypothetical protein
MAETAPVDAACPDLQGRTTASLGSRPDLNLVWRPVGGLRPPEVACLKNLLKCRRTGDADIRSHFPDPLKGPEIHLR